MSTVIIVSCVVGGYLLITATVSGVILAGCYYLTADDYNNCEICKIFLFGFGGGIISAIFAPVVIPINIISNCLSSLKPKPQQTVTPESTQPEPTQK